MTARISIHSGLTITLLAVLTACFPVRAEPPLTLGVHPYLPSTELVRRFAPLVEHLSNRLGRPIELQIARTYQSHAANIGSDGVDLAYVGPATYVKITAKHGPKPILARLEVDGKPGFQGVIVVREQSPVMELADLKGRSFAFGNRNSTMSFVVPRHLLNNAGVDLNALSHYEHLRNHQDVALGVLAGYFDAGAVKEEVFWKYRSRGLRALTHSPVISEHLFITRSGLSPDLIEHLRELLLTLADEPNGASLLRSLKKNLTRLVPAHDRDYDNLRRILNGNRSAAEGQ